MKQLNFYHFQSKLVKFTLIIFSCLVLSSCWFPQKFVLAIKLDRNGDYLLEYRGGLIHLGLANDVSSITMKQVNDYTKSLKRHKDFQSIQHVNEAVFLVHYKREGNLYRERSFYFVESNAWFFRMFIDNNNNMAIQTNTLAAKHKKQLTDAGFQPEGLFRLVTDAPNISHNGLQLDKQGTIPATIDWQISSFSDAFPMVILSR